MRELLHQMIVDSLGMKLQPSTRRDVVLPRVENKAHAIIGMRRSGKTTFLMQCLSERLAAGVPREALLYLNFEDERLTGLQSNDLQWILEDYYRLLPQWRDQRTVTFFLDEIQLVGGWERFVRRLMDTERIGVFLSGSSSRLLSQELASSMRGRALQTVVLPFSFREALRHQGMEPSRKWKRLTKAERSVIDAHLHAYLKEGGFPEAQGLETRDRRLLLRSYVDVAVLRDVLERHGISNPTSLRWLQRQLLSSPAGTFSIQKHYDTLRSQGIAVAKDTVHAYLEYLEDAFLVRIVSMHTGSERQRMVNPRKAYPIDPGLIEVYERTPVPNTGHALETVIMLELERRGCEIGYIRTKEGYEVDFHASFPDGTFALIQVASSIAETSTYDREVRALESAARLHPHATPLLITLDTIPPNPSLPPDIQWRCAADWLLNSSF
ncbi:ATP-binding protein [bacterium]|nr:ATP-binding protein [bacterium]